MANIKKLKANGQDIVPITHEQAVLDSNGVTLDSKLNAINNAISRLENNSTSNVPVTYEWELGGVTKTGELKAVTNRIRVVDYITFSEKTTFQSNEPNYVLRWYKYDTNHTFVTELGSWVTRIEFEASADYVYKVAIRKTDDSDISTNVVSCFEIYTGTKETDNKNNTKPFYNDYPALFYPHKFKLEAHRGYSDKYPENTLLAFEEAGKRSEYSGIETDVHRTSDGVFVLMHDSTIDRTTNGTGKPSAYTYEELQAFYIDGGNGWDAQYANQFKIPKLTEYLKICNKYGKIPYIQVDQIESSYLGELIELLDKEGWKGRCILTSFNLSDLFAVRNITDEYVFEYMILQSTDDAPYNSALNTLKSYKNVIFRPNAASFLGKSNAQDFIYKFREAGILLECHGLPVGDTSTLNKMLEFGIEGATCNSYIGFSDLLGVTNTASETTELNIMSIVLGNYQIKYNSTDDTLDFIFNGVIDEPVVPPTSDGYVTNGLSMYIDANDVTSYGSIRDLTGKQTVTNHGVSTTLDNGCLKFVASESDYIDGGFKPNLTQWSAEAYFYYPSRENAGTLLSWGASGNRTTISVWDSFMIAIRDDVQHTITSTVPTSLTHLVLTYNNGTIIAYVNGVKSQIATNANVMSSQAGNLMIGTKYNATADFANMYLKSLRFYDGKVLTDEEALQNYNYETKNNYVTEGLSLYIDAQDVTSYGSIRDLTGKQNIVNHGVSTTLDNGCLNFVASESDYIDSGFKPNLTKWSAEVYFYYTDMPTGSETVLAWGLKGSDTIVAHWSGTDLIIVVNNHSTPYRIISVPTSLTHLILTYNNGAIIAYVNGVKTELATNANVMTSQGSNLLIGSSFSIKSFADMHLKSLRFYDGKVLTDEEALQNYNYEINRGIIKPTWTYNMKLDTNTGLETAADKNACSNFIPYDSSYNYTLAIDAVEFFRVYYYDSSQSYIKNDSIANNFNGVINPPENTAYIRLKLNRGTVEFADLDNHVILRKTLKFVLNPTWIDNRNINIQGVEFDDTLSMITDYLTKEDGYNYTINLTSVSSVKIYFFNSSKTFISRTDNLTVDSTDILIEFPENTSYFRVKSDKGTATIDNANDYIIIKKVAK